MSLDRSIVGWFNRVPAGELGLYPGHPLRARRRAGSVTDLDELAFVTENTAGVPQQVLPTFPALIVQGLARVPYGDIDRSQLVHAEQSVNCSVRSSRTGAGGTRPRSPRSSTRAAGHWSAPRDC